MEQFMNEPIYLVQEIEMLKDIISTLQDEIKELNEKVDYYEKMEADLCELTGEIIETFIYKSYKRV